MQLICGITKITESLFCSSLMYMYFILTRTVETLQMVFISFNMHTFYQYFTLSLLLNKDELIEKRTTVALSFPLLLYHLSQGKWF